jgi:hypothetical protein
MEFLMMTKFIFDFLQEIKASDKNVSAITEITLLVK